MIKIISFAGISKFYEEFETVSWISLMLNHHVLMEVKGWHGLLISTGFYYSNTCIDKMEKIKHYYSFGEICQQVGILTVRNHLVAQGMKNAHLN